MTRPQAGATATAATAKAQTQTGTLANTCTRTSVRASRGEGTGVRTGRPAGRRYSGLVPPTRYRCTACGNLTRFDVTISRRTTAFHHFSVGGELDIEDERVLDERVEAVSCRWCGTGSSVVALTGDDETDDSVSGEVAG
jgi:hypothetical protein